MSTFYPIQALLDAEITWVKEADHPEWTSLYCDESCRLRMNDFPDEPLYTLIWRDESIDFDDTPPKWNIQ